MNYYDKAEIFAWTPLLGFDKDAPDKGVSNFIERTQFNLHGVSLFVFAADIVHQHTGMDKVRILPPDNCAYHACPYNEERKRQEWTNHDLRDLLTEFRKKGIQSYMSIMGTDGGNKFHNDWLEEHPELKNDAFDWSWSLFVLKRFKDGTYYEDFFADKVCETMLDYGFDGLHVSDNFCPQARSLYMSDYTADMAGQFMDHTGIKLPDEIGIDGEDTPEKKIARRDWIWKNHKLEWINFYSWRWESFWKKIADRLHAIGKKIFVLGMYCTDPFETLFVKGIDLRKIVKSGVDYLMPNMAANGSSIARIRPWRYFEWLTMIPLTDAFCETSRNLNMLGVKDAAEEWDLLHYAPSFLERDLYYLPAFFRFLPDGTLKRSLDGFNVCLADGIYKDEWKWLKDRFDIGFDQTPNGFINPTFVWSDNMIYNLLPEYCENRRWPAHKFMYEINELGAHTGAMVRAEHITDACGNLFVPDFDVLSAEEQKKILEYKGGAVIGTISANKKNLLDGVKCDIYFEDHDTPFVNAAFAFNMQIENKDAILDLLPEDDDTEIIDPETVEDSNNPYRGKPIPYQKVSIGFKKALAALVKASYMDNFTSEYPFFGMKMKDGAIRLYVINNDRLHYSDAIITSKRYIKEVKNVSKFPLLPVKFSETGTFGFQAQDYPGDLRTFRVPVTQGSISIVDVYLK